MPVEDTWLLLALGAVLLYGVSQVAQKVSLSDIPASAVVSLSILLATPISLVCLAPYLVTGEILDVEPLSMVLGLIAATFGQMGYYMYLEAAQRGPISIVGSVTAAYPIMVVAVAIGFLSEWPGSIQLAGALLVTGSIIALSYFHGGSSKSSGVTGRYFVLCIGSMLLYGFWGIFTKLTLDRIEPLLFLGIYVFVIPPTVLLYYRYKGIRLRQSIPSWSVPFIIAIIASEVGNIGFFLEVNAVADGPASIVFPLVAASPVVVVLLAYGFLKERLSKIEFALVAAVIAGIVLVSLV
jgi:drug/metabolite transporter (DMT)-like permease